MVKMASRKFRTFTGMYATDIFTDEEIRSLFCHSDNRYDQETLLEIIAEYLEMGDIDADEHKRLKKKIDKLPPKVAVFNNLEWY